MIDHNRRQNVDDKIAQHKILMYTPTRSKVIIYRKIYCKFIKKLFTFKKDSWKLLLSTIYL